MNKLFLFLFYCLVTSASAQSIGQIKGSIMADNKPLPFAIIKLLKTNFTSTSDSLGFFQITTIPIGKYQLLISYVGHENFQTEIVVTETIGKPIAIQLIPLNSKLNEVVVTGTMKEVTSLESVTKVEVYNQKYFQRNPVANLFEALATMNGIFPDVDNGVSNTTDVQINGLEGNYSMFLIDGVPAMNGLAGIYALNAFPMSIIDKVEVLKGSSSTLYGSEAIAGVINIKTKTAGKTPRFYGNVSLNSMLTANADFSVSFKLKRVSSFIALSGETVNYRWDIDKDGFMDIPLTKRGSIFNKWSFTRKDNGLANIYARYLFEDKIGGQNVPVSTLRNSKDYYSEAIRTHQWQTGLQYQLPIQEKVVLLLDYSEHRQQANYGLNQFDGLQRAGFSQLTFSKKIDAIHELLIGASYRIQYYNDNTSLSQQALTGTGPFTHIGGLFMEDELTLPKNNSLLLGARFDYSNQGGPIFCPRVNYKWISNDKLNTIRIGAGTGYRVANLMNEGFGALNGSRQVVVEEKLKPESTIQTNASYGRVQSFKGGLLNIEVGGFYTYFFNMVNPEYGEDAESIVYSNSKGGAMAGGFSVNADFTFNYPLKIGVGFTYTNVFELEIEDNGEVEKEIPTHSPPFVANFFLSYTFAGPQLSIDWTGNLVSPMLLSTVPDDYRPSKSPWYTIQNIQLTKKFTNGIELYAGVKNFFNFLQKEPILRSFDPFNKNVAVDNPNNYRFDTTYGFTSTEGIKGFVGLRYTLQ